MSVTWLFSCLGVSAGVLAGNDPACTASTGGDFNVPWQVELVIFTPKAFQSDPNHPAIINTRITTVAQLQSLVNDGDVFIVETPITFDCAVVSEQTYDNGAPLVVPYP
jgi:hypothetical protein